MAPLHILLTLLFSFILTDTAPLKLQQDLQKDLTKLQQSNSHFISDNSTLDPSVQTVANDLQLFGIVSQLDISSAKYEHQQQGPHQVHQWTFNDGNIRRITQIESSIQLDTTVTQRYLNGRAPTQQHISNNFTFRTYLISTAQDQNKLYYLTEADQGLLRYKSGEKQVQITYTSPKEGLSDVLPKYEQQVQSLAAALPTQ